MAEIEFFATWEEIELVQWLLDRHCEFIPQTERDPPLQTHAENSPASIYINV